MKIPIARPEIGSEEKQAVMAVLESGQLVQGAIVEAFEQAFATYVGVRYAVATSSGTTALMTAMMAHSIKPGDEVIIPSLSFFATAASVLSTGARPVFADIDPDTFCLSPQAAEAAITPNTVAIMPVHLYGLPANMSAFEAICQRHGLILLEDAAQAHGASIGGRRVGSWGTASFSFYPSKNMTTGEGGIVTTNSDEIARKLRMIRNQGMAKTYQHDMLGYNFRMTNVAAAIGLPQLNRLPEFNARRRENARYFDRHLQRVKTPGVPEGYEHVYHQYTVTAPDGMRRDVMLDSLKQSGIDARVYYPIPLHCQPVIQEMYGTMSLPETERAAKQIFSLPIYPSLTAEELEYIVQRMNAI